MVNGHWVSWGGSLGDRLANMLCIAGVPTTPERLLEGSGEQCQEGPHYYRSQGGSPVREENATEVGIGEMGASRVREYRPDPRADTRRIRPSVARPRNGAMDVSRV